MEELKKRLAPVKERWDALSMRVRVGIAVGASVLLAMGLLAYAYGSEPSYEVLFSNLSEQDAARITERLGAMGVTYELEAGGTVMVPDDQVHQTRLTLASEGLPSGGSVGFEIFDTQRFGESDFSEQIQYRRALEGELGRTISHIAGVESARVHLVLPERTLFVTEEQAATASVALHLRPGWRLREEQVQGVVHLVASSVPGLTPESVTVVDGDGNPLGRPRGEGSSEVVSDAERLREQIERNKERAVQQLLDASLGPGVAVVRVSADVSMSRQEHLQETYDPDRIATRSFEINEERDPNAQGDAQGIPGAASNLPGGVAAESTAGDTGLARRSERRNYEVTKTVVREVRPVGRVARLTVAVVVDGVWEGEGAARTFTARDQEDLARISALVASAAGTQQERGDVVTVECVPFASSSETAQEVVDPLAQLDRYEPVIRPALIALGVLFVLLVAFIIWVRYRRRKKREAEELAKREAEAEARGEKALPSGQVDQLPTPKALGKKSEAQNQLDAEEERRALADYEQLRALALEVVRRDPELAARVVRGWLAADEANQSEEEAA